MSGKGFGFGRECEVFVLVFEDQSFADQGLERSGEATFGDP